MWKAALVFCYLLALGWPLWAQEDVTDAAITPQDCSMDCIRQGGPGCEYCRITQADVKGALGFKPINRFGSCIPWPCFDLLGEDPELCQHYVQAPNDVKVEFVQEANPKSDTIVVSWKPSHYGIAFLRGFQVSLQALGGSTNACQLFLFHRNLSLPASHAHKVYKSDPFPGLSLGSQYAVTVMALPVPEEWKSFYHSKIFSTRSCAEKNGLEQCKKDWYPKQIKVEQEGTAVTVTFNLAPPNLGIRSYFSLCYANGMKKYTDITPNSPKNKTHHSFQLEDLQEGTNYTCEIAANEVDAVRRTFNVQVLHIKKGGTSPLSVTPSLALLIPVCLAVVAMLIVCLAALTRRKPKLHMKKLNIKPDVITQDEESGTQGEVVALPGKRPSPPRLLMCYSSNDGPAHIRAVMQLGAFIQQHMATQGLNIKSKSPKLEDETDDTEADTWLDLRPNNFSSDVAVQLVGEEVGQAKARGQDLFKYMSVIFEHSTETDIPTELRLVSHYTLTRDLPLLFSHLHNVALHRPGGYLKISNISEEGFKKLPAGAALQQAIHEAGAEMRSKKRHPVEVEEETQKRQLILAETSAI
ncbi:interleukin-17 receptor D isoform X2 [Halichoeres trimaculatus]|uniref:interleukin-17 receptor D isoform X2 n=1 Tax=Halichoeres trimaculatus TaxID=147232 RepID=UPI003D9DEFAF